MRNKCNMCKNVQQTCHQRKYSINSSCCYHYFILGLPPATVISYAIAAGQSLGKKPMCRCWIEKLGLLAHSFFQRRLLLHPECPHCPFSLPLRVSLSYQISTQTCLCVGSQDWSNWLWPWYMCFSLHSLLLSITQGVQQSLPFSPCDWWTCNWHFGSSPLWGSITPSYLLRSSCLRQIHSYTFGGFHNKSHCKARPFLGEVIEFLIWRISFLYPRLYVEHQIFQLMGPKWFPPSLI